MYNLPFTMYNFHFVQFIAIAHQAKASSHLQCTILNVHQISFLSWILYINEEKGIAWHALACLSAFLALYNESELVYCHPTTTNFYKRADDGSYHVSEESVCTHNEHPATVTQIFPFCLCNLAESGLHIGVRLAKTSKILVFK